MCGIKKEIYDSFSISIYRVFLLFLFFSFSPSVFPKRHGVKAVANKKIRKKKMIIDHALNDFCSSKRISSFFRLVQSLAQFIVAKMHRILSCCLSPRLANLITIQ